MPEGYLLMSAEERERSHLIRRTVEKSLSQREASEQLGICERQFKRLVQAWKRHGDAGLLSRQRGRAAHNRMTESTRVRIERLLRETYPDFGPTLAAEKLAERDGIAVSRETVRRIQTRLKPHRPKQRGEKRVFQLRDRRPRFGELVQKERPLAFTVYGTYPVPAQAEDGKTLDLRVNEIVAAQLALLEAA